MANGGDTGSSISPFIFAPKQNTMKPCPTPYVVDRTGQRRRDTHMPALAHMYLEATERRFNNRPTVRRYVDNPHFICREPVRTAAGTCSSCDALVDTDGQCQCSN